MTGADSPDSAALEVGRCDHAATSSSSSLDGMRVFAVVKVPVFWQRQVHWFLRSFHRRGLDELRRGTFWDRVHRHTAGGGVMSTGT